MKRVSPAMVVACLALGVALSGAGYAVTAVPRASVGTAQLKRNAVVSSKVKDRSLLARDFKRGQLQRGPRGPQGPAGPTGPAGPRGSDAQFNGAAAGGDLAGTYPNPTLRPDLLAGLERATRIQYGRGSVTSTTQLVLLAWPELGVEVRTDGDSDLSSSLRIRNTRASGTLWVLTSESGTATAVAAGATSAEFLKTGGLAGWDLLVSADPAVDPNRALLVHCGTNFSTTPAELHCFGIRSEA